MGAGPGLGESLARRLASEGINIALASRDWLRLERLAGELRRGEVRASGFTCDVTDELSVQEEFPQSQPEDLAETICFLHRQPRTAWTSEIDLRPWNERFWEHC
ncbi:MAG: SDR family NAD(P)-dependent oxidoreductase [Candidatus Accumulibacter propinquus]|uniref:SDR family NAD(P)-dependent oxidoreductase n=1 Tax=Candidatus Accumulibacter propinquus TaxID=2954380 RepID=UPI002FC331E5